MKKVYTTPSVTSTMQTSGDLPPFAVGAALVGGYAAGRAVTHVMEAHPMRKLTTFEASGAAHE